MKKPAVISVLFSEAGQGLAKTVSETLQARFSDMKGVVMKTSVGGLGMVSKQTGEAAFSGLQVTFKGGLSAPEAAQVTDDVQDAIESARKTAEIAAPGTLVSISFGQ